MSPKKRLPPQITSEELLTILRQTEVRKWIRWSRLRLNRLRTRATLAEVEGESNPYQTKNLNDLIEQLDFMLDHDISTLDPRFVRFILEAIFEKLHGSKETLRGSSGQGG